MWESHLGKGVDIYGGDDNKARFNWTMGPRYNHLNRGAPITGVKTVVCDLHHWEMPGTQQTVLVGLVMLCPNCKHPILGPCSPQTRIDEHGRLTLPMPQERPLTCPGHWPSPSGGHQRCGWQAVIREGVAHNPRCPAAQMPLMSIPTPSDCVCGGLLTDGEDKQLQGMRG